MLEFRTLIINEKKQRIYNICRNVSAWILIVLTPFTIGSKGVETGFSILMPDYYFFITFFLLLITFLVLTNYVIFNKGIIIFTPDKVKIQLKNKKFTVVYKIRQLNNLRLQCNTPNYADSKAIFEVGIENWIHFTHYNQAHHFQFQIKSQEEERLFFKIISHWSDNGVIVK